MPTQGMPFHYVNRGEWKSLPSLQELPKLDKPIRFVRLTYTGKYHKCHSNKSCTKSLRWLQQHDMNELNLPDLQPNFLVAGDGYVYEGRGWDFQPEKLQDHPELDGKFLEIAYIGDYATRPPNNEMLRLSWLVLETGTDHNYLAKDFEILDLGGPAYPDIGKDEPHY